MASPTNAMPTDATPATNLIRLQSKEHEEVLDVIDQLRSEGIGKYIDLPQLIVCGDQSSGKSSVLEAISGLNFPRKDNVCTRFATELILRRSPAPRSTNTSVVSVSIIPDDGRPSDEKKRLRQFQSPTLQLNEFGDIVESAEAQMAFGRQNPSYFKDVLRVEVTGPDQPHLTLVDLPGLYHASDEKQTVKGASFVESLLKSYARSSRSVILAVISAKSEKALQKVTTLIDEIDPRGERTMGIITKPDALDEGSELENSFFKLAQNKNKSTTFKLGWHVLKNRGFKDRDCSSEERNRLESEFLAAGIWSSLPRSQVGISALRPRLSSILKDHILNHLPGFISDTLSSLKETQVALQKLGGPRQTLSEQRRYLFQTSEKFNALIGDSINGIYFDPFFGDALEETGYQKRLRAVVQNRLTDFSATMHRRGQKQQIVEEGQIFYTNGINRSKFVEEVRVRMRRSRGRELPGTFNPLIIGDLFYIQSQPWEEIALESVELLLQDLRKVVMPILRETLDERSIEGVLNYVVNPQLIELETGLRKKTDELLRPQRAGHPITYNHDFLDAIQKARDRHFRNTLSGKLKSFFGSEYPLDLSKKSKFEFSMNGLINALVAQTETDAERFACSEAIDCMQAYYKVALKKFVDDFSNLAVEKCLLEPLLGMFSPRTVDRMADDVVQDIAGEDQSTIEERNRLNNKLSVLERSLARLSRLDRHNLTAPSTVPEVHDSDHKAHTEKSLPAAAFVSSQNSFASTSKTTSSSSAAAYQSLSNGVPFTFKPVENGTSPRPNTGGPTIVLGSGSAPAPIFQFPPREASTTSNGFTFPPKEASTISSGVTTPVVKDNTAWLSSGSNTSQATRSTSPSGNGFLGTK